MAKSGLGKGLGALISGVQSAAVAESTAASATQAAESGEVLGGVLTVDIRKVEPNPTQPRQFFDEETLDELAESMKTFGIVQPLLVTEDNGNYTIIAGERRYRAARKAQLTEIPVIVKDYTEMEILQVALLENIQRQDLTSIEEAACYKRLMEDFFFSPDDIAVKLGKSKHAVISALHLLELTPRAQELAAEGKLTASHAKVLLNVEDEELQAVCAEKIAETSLSVRESETMIAAALKAAAKKDTPAVKDEPDENAEKAYRRAETELKHVLGSQVHIVPGKKKSKIEIEYYSAEDLERLLALFRKL
ncbi:MAG: ParB/RepB/Spo0J family partition protein [Defluviitaleaceae bacterium]|nr:ParB/RepB/Spo0J family partition protein [Defluviitaleaceae bacterium]MCL2261798.1 ParB/RepB/Spo0J family partition protein [Defluviitaleaceae bacterium]